MTLLVPKLKPNVRDVTLNRENFASYSMIVQRVEVSEAVNESLDPPP